MKDGRRPDVSPSVDLDQRRAPVGETDCPAGQSGPGQCVSGLDREAQRFGTHLLAVLETMIAAVYDVRSGAPPPAGGLRAHHAATLKALLDACERHANSRQMKTRALARELLNNWDTFWVVLDHPDLPLTNNEAERALRHLG